MNFTSWINTLQICTISYLNLMSTALTTAPPSTLQQTLLYNLGYTFFWLVNPSALRCLVSVPRRPTLALGSCFPRGEGTGKSKSAIGNRMVGRFGKHCLLLALCAPVTRL